MKHIKIYEKFLSAYNLETGDYVLIAIYYVRKPIEYKLGKIIKISNDMMAPFPYKIATDDNNISVYNYTNILRLLTPEEIEEFEAKQNANKYNL